MRLDQSSMDLSTLADKIRNGEIDLQPDFQRGQVWSESKKKRLVDTVLREWYIPAVHIVVNDDLDREEVLDGQQRLRTVLEFMDDEFSVDGSIEPADKKISALGGKRYSDLPDSVRSRFRRFTLTTIRLRDYRPEEPGELFFRLNQLTALTAAEQRNALIGEPRNQVRRLAEQLERNIGAENIGFSNSRMNYDDVLSRLAVTLEENDLGAKITATRLEKRYRSGLGFSARVTESISFAINTLAEAYSREWPWRQNKASLFSWLFFVTDNRWTAQPDNVTFFVKFFNVVEAIRASSAKAVDFISSGDASEEHSRVTASKASRESVIIFNDRSSSRVNDVASILLRDLALHTLLFEIAPMSLTQSAQLKSRSKAVQELTTELAQLPEDVAERATAESRIAGQWEAHREARKAR